MRKKLKGRIQRRKARRTDKDNDDTVDPVVIKDVQSSAASTKWLFDVTDTEALKSAKQQCECIGNAIRPASLFESFVTVDRSALARRLAGVSIAYLVHYKPRTGLFALG